MIRIASEVEMTPKILKYLIEQHKTHAISRLVKLEDYYSGNQEILKRVMTDASKPNNKVVNPYANYITDMFTGYFMGESISYSSSCDEDSLKELQMINIFNDEADENSELAKDASIYGKSYEMLYVDGEGATRFKKVNTKEVITIYDNTIENEMLYAIRFYGDTDIMGENPFTIVEVYSKSNIVTYKADVSLNEFTEVSNISHYFSLVPFVEYKNNDEGIGDFELVISLIDSYDKLCADNLNDFEYFTDSYLGLYGMEADVEDIKLMKENRVLLMPEGGKAEWIIKNVNDTQVENIKTRIEQDIHKFSKCPAMTDKDFAGNASGVAMKFKLMGMENVAAVKERKFKKGLQRRIELICNIMALKSSIFDWRSVEITFKRNLPVNTMELADMINKLRGLVSDETLINQLPFVEDVSKELERVAAEKDASAASMFDVVGGDANYAEEEQVLDTGSAGDSTSTV